METVSTANKFLDGIDHQISKNKDLSCIWEEMISLWLERLAPNTQRAYRKAWDLLFAYSQKMPWEITKAHIAAWAASMRRVGEKGKGLAETTVQLRLAAVSSLFSFAMNDYEILTPDGDLMALARRNPVKGKSLCQKIIPYGKAVHLSNEQVSALLNAIPRDSVLGLRDYALILTYLSTGRRNSEVRNLRWGEIGIDGETVWYRWSGKGKIDQRNELPWIAWKAIRDYLRAAGRLEGMRESDYIFTALTDRAKRLPNVKGNWTPTAQPISMHEAGRILKKYARKAGLQADTIHIHALRHTWAEVHREVGDDVVKISKGLAHSSIAVTQVYLDHRNAISDDSWGKVEKLWGL